MHKINSIVLSFLMCLGLCGGVMCEDTHDNVAKQQENQDT